MVGRLRHLYWILATVAVPLVLPQQAIAFSDLAVKMEATPDTVALGEELTYSVSVTNLGPDATRYITVSDRLPFGVTLKSISSADGECAVIASVPFCNLEGLAVGATATVKIVISVDEKQEGGTLFNTVHVAASKNKGEPTENNHAEAITVVREDQK